MGRGNTTKNESMTHGLKLGIIAGTIPLQSARLKVRTGCLVDDEHGICVVRYDKIYSFDVHVFPHV